MSSVRYRTLVKAVRGAFDHSPKAVCDADSHIEGVFESVRRLCPDATMDELTFILDEMRVNGTISGIIINALGGIENLDADLSIADAVQRAACSGSSYAKMLVDSGFLDRHQLHNFQ
jgi:hypothetical protein